MHIKLFKYAKCNNCNRICKNKNKKTLLLRDTLFENNYLCLYWFIRNYQMRKKVKKSLKRMSDESLEEMEVHYFSQSELDCLHDTVYNSVGVKLNNDELVDLIYTTPDNIKEIGYEFGLCDTVFSDMMFAWLRQIYNELAIGLRNKATTYSLMALVNEIGNTNDVKEPLLKQYMKLIKG